MKKTLKKIVSILSLGALIAPLTALSQVNAQEQLVVYTNSLDDAKQEWIESKIEEANFDYDVEFVIGGGGEVFDRLMAEKNDPQADVAFGMDEGQWSTLVSEGLVVEWNPEWKADIPTELIQGDGYFYPWAEQRIFAFYNPEFLEEADAPTSLEQLGQDEKYANNYIIPHEMGGSTNQKIVLTILLNHLDENGELGVSEEGWQAAADFLANGYMPTEDQSKHALIADGEVAISFHFSGGIPNAEKEFGFTAVPINPEYGVFTMSEQVGIINKGEDQDYANAIEFAEWWGSEDIQRGWVEAFGTVPANEKVLDSVDPRVMELYDATDRMDVNWEVYNTYLSDWVEKIELELMPI